MAETKLKNDIDFNIPDRTELVTRQKSDTTIGGLSLRIELVYTENSAKELSNKEGSKWEKLQDAYLEEISNPIKVLLAKFLDRHPEVIPTQLASMGFTTSLEGYATRAKLYDMAEKLSV